MKLVKTLVIGRRSFHFSDVLDLGGPRGFDQDANLCCVTFTAAYIQYFLLL